MYELADFGSFMIPGRVATLSGQAKKQVQRNADLAITIDPNGSYAVENTYVEYYIPKHVKETMVFVHGGGLCGNIWSTTPDGRKGFVQLFLAKGYAVYVVDTVERGRAGWCSVPEIWPETAESRTAETTWSAFRIGAPSDFISRKPFEHQQFPVSAFDKFVCYQVPRWDVHMDAAVKGLSQLLQSMGTPCVVIGHSQGCDLVMRTFEQQAQCISHIILLEPASCYVPKVPLDLDAIKLLMLWGDYLTHDPLWTRIYEASQPYQLALQAKGIKTDHWHLPDMNIRGNSHALMLDKNNAHIADMLMHWMA